MGENFCEFHCRGNFLQFTLAGVTNLSVNFKINGLLHG